MPTVSPRTTYAKLRDNAHINPGPRKRWELKPRDQHTRREKNRLADLAFASVIATFTPVGSV